jgi:hypothetical protein
VKNGGAGDVQVAMNTPNLTELATALASLSPDDRDADAEREAAPHVRTAPCAGCGDVSEAPVCGDCRIDCETAMGHEGACRCRACRVYARVVAAGVVSL